MTSSQPPELQHTSAALMKRRAANGSPTHTAEQHPLLRLQNHAGNAQVARMLAQREEAMEDEDEMAQAKHDPSLLQREAGMEDDEEMAQAKHDPGAQSSPVVGLEGGSLGADVTQRIDAGRGTGSGLAEGTRSQMESAFGADFGGVKVHQDAESDSLARNMTAKAFTTGSDIFLRQDQNAGDTSLMAHELTHVVQQSSGADSGGSGMTVGAADDHLEHEADEVAHSVTAGRKVEAEDQKLQ